MTSKFPIFPYNETLILYKEVMLNFSLKMSQSTRRKLLEFCQGDLKDRKFDRNGNNAVMLVASLVK